MALFSGSPWILNSCFVASTWAGEHTEHTQAYMHRNILFTHCLCVHFYVNLLDIIKWLLINSLIKMTFSFWSSHLTNNWFDQGVGCIGTHTYNTHIYVHYIFLLHLFLKDEITCQALIFFLFLSILLYCICSIRCLSVVSLIVFLNIINNSINKY